MDRTMRARLARQIIQNPVFDIIEQDMEQEYYHRWCAETDAGVREEVWRERQAMLRFMGTFRSQASDHPEDGDDEPPAA